jgi:diguanylate cyclase (GGDEF)-like protein
VSPAVPTSTPSAASGENRGGVAGGSIGDTLRAVWEKHRAGVLERVDLIERAVTALSAAELEEPLRGEAQRAAHMLAGSVGMFGFMRASEAGRDLELELVDPAPERAPTLSTLIAVLRQELEGEGELVTPEGARPDNPAGEQVHVLVVDDDRELCERIAAEAVSLGMDCNIALSPHEARVLCERRSPTVVLLDLTFPPEGMDDAYKLLSELSNATPPVPVLILTVSDTFTDRVEAARRGARAFLTKSLQPAQVLDAVGQLLDRERLTATPVLLVDDDPVILETMRALLESRDLMVATLTDPLRFWEALEEVAPELLVLDVDMPGVDGPELCRIVRNDPRWSHLAVIFLTARTDAATSEQAFRAGADDYLVKPIAGPELLTRVANRLDRIRLYRLQAETDSLTGLANRAKSNEGLAQLAAFAGRFSEPLSIAMLDLDRLKFVNDRYGHAAGDIVLRRLAERLRRDFRGNDVVGRRGGEEFIVGMYGMTRQDGVRRLEDTLDRFHEEQFTAGRETFQVSFSAGVAEYPLDGCDLNTLYHTADDALYRAKAAGRARVLAAY